MNTLHSCNYFSSLVCWLVFTDGLFGNILVSSLTEHIKEGREEYPAKLFNAHETNYFKWLQVYPQGHFGRFPFDQKFPKFRVWERMEQTFSGISFRNFGCTSRGWPKIPENRNNRKIPFHSTIPARAQFLRARKSNSTWLPILLLNISVPLVIMRQITWMFFCTTFAPEPRQTFILVSSAKLMHISYAQCLKLM